MSSQRLVPGLALTWGLVLGFSATAMAQPPERADRVDGGTESSAPPRDRDDPRGPAEDDEADRRIAPQIVPPEHRHRHWILGVYAENLDTGVRVTRVYPRSPAARIGLERDDIIISIDGYQIGYVGRRLYDLGTELQLRAGRRGEVRLLVLDRRTDRLRNLDVQLERADGDYRPDDDDYDDDGDEEENDGGRLATLVGRVNLRMLRGALPFDTKLTVRLVELSRDGAPGNALAQDEILRPSSMPIPFALRYRRRDIQPGGSYGIEAMLESRGRVLFETRRPERIAPGQGTIEVMLDPVR